MFVKIKLVISFFCLTVFFQFCTAQQNGFSDIGPKKLRILAAFGHPGNSHFKFFEPLLDELAKRGHEMTVISFFPKENKGNDFANYRDIDLRHSPSDVFLNVVDLSRIKDETYKRPIRELKMLKDWNLENCEKSMTNSQLQQLLNSDETFDLILTEAFNGDCLLCLVEKFKAPFVALSSHDLMPWIHHRFEIPYELSYVPNVLSGYSFEMNFIDRLLNAAVFYFSNIYYNLFYQPPTEKILQNYCKVDGRRYINDITKDTAAILVNTHYSYNGVRPTTPNIVEVGGLHVFRKPKKLPEDIQKFLDDAKEGVLFISFGSMVKSSTMPKDKLRDMLKIFKELPVKVLWKWEEDKFPEKIPNLMLKSWLPQYDILHHPNVVAYLGHGGLLGVSEGIYTGVPMILIPFYGDQFHNAATVEARGAAKVLRFGDLNEENLRSVINKVLNDPSYRENARMLSKAYRDRPQSPLETAVWWCEHIGRNKNYNYLKSAAAKLSWYQYYLLDVVAVICTIALVLMLVTWRLLSLFVTPKVRTGKEKQQ